MRTLCLLIEADNRDGFWFGHFRHDVGKGYGLYREKYGMMCELLIVQAWDIP